MADAMSNGATSAEPPRKPQEIPSASTPQRGTILVPVADPWRVLPKFIGALRTR